MSKVGLAAGRPSENRKKQAMASMADDDNKLVRVNFDLKESQHQRLKIFAAKSRRSISDIMREMIEKHILTE